LAGLAERVSGGYKLTRKGIVEVYKSVMNYVIELPVNATELLTRLGSRGEHPQEIELKAAPRG
ncbi:MAG: hypothetical protein DRO12_04800, partial [Thermoprotei archaeon]